MQLFPYQTDALDAIKRFNGKALLALDMGLGKTVVAIAAMSHYQQWPVVVVAPACMTWQWRKEALQHSTLTNAEIVVVEKSNFPTVGIKLFILSYERATRYALELSILRPGMIILDESHYIKNRKAKRTKQLVPLCRASNRVLLLTGTPVLNRPEELWSQLQALNISLGDYYEFGQRYCAAKMKHVGKGQMVWDFSGASNVAELSQILRSSCMIRKTKDEIAHQLPEKRRSKIVVEGLPNLASIEEIRKKVFTAMDKTRDSLAAWRVVTSGSDLAANIFTAYKETAELKAPAAAQICAEIAESGPLVIFAHHKITIDAIIARLKAHSISGVRITGSESPAQKQAAVELFQRGEVQVAVCSLKAASTGITLTRASDMIIAEMPFSPGDALQAENRIHRIGQNAAVLIRYLVAEDTLDDVLWGMISRKDSLVGELIDSRDGSQFAGLDEQLVGGYVEVFRTIFDKLINEWSLKNDGK